MNRSLSISLLSRFAIFLAVAVAGFTLDMATKYISFDHPEYRLLDSMYRDESARQWVLVGTDEREIQVVPGYFHLRATVNEGAVFGLGQGRQPVFVAVSVVALGFLAFLVVKAVSRFELIILGMLLAGVLGNLYDRVKYNFVRDMFYAFPDWGIFPWIFNLADCFLVVGVGVLMLRNLLPEKKDAPATLPSASTTPAPSTDA